MSSGNTVCWVDIPTTDLDRAIRFYSALLGQAVNKQSEHGMSFGLLPHAGSNVSGCLIKSDDHRPSEHGPMIYLSVDGRMDAAIEAVGANGGKVIKPKHAIGPYGHKAVIADSEGNRVALHAKNA